MSKNAKPDESPRFESSVNKVWPPLIGPDRDDPIGNVIRTNLKRLLSIGVVLFVGLITPPVLGFILIMARELMSVNPGAQSFNNTKVLGVHIWMAFYIVFNACVCGLVMWRLKRPETRLA